MTFWNWIKYTATAFVANLAALIVFALGLILLATCTGCPGVEIGAEFERNGKTVGVDVSKDKDGNTKIELHAGVDDETDD